ncbi:MAG: hypothetical protein MJ147_03040 [Clostridia bacterium]|nr:hypothetical protein [Clostridia bacterium]
MTLGKRILSVLLAMLMVFSVLQMGVSALNIANGENTDGTMTMVDNGEGRYILPEATVTATPTIRVATKRAGYGDFVGGSTIVKATPSGVPAITGNYTKEAYSGESPEWPTVTFECDLPLTTDSDKASVQLNCSSISGLTYEVSNPSNNKWVWTITGGTIAAGNYADFTVSFNYTHTDKLTGKTETKAYKAYGSSYVDIIAQPAGAYVHSERKNAFHSNTYNEMVYRILGKNTKGSYYETGTDVGEENKEKNGSSYFSHGYYDFQLADEFGWSTTAAAFPQGGMVLLRALGEGNIYFNTGIDRQRPVSSTYIDISKGKALDDESINLRYSAFNQDDASGHHHDHDGDYLDQISGIRVFPGEVAWGSDTPNITTAENEINFGLSADAALPFHNKSTYNTSSPYAITNSEEPGRVYGLNIPFTGTAYANSKDMKTLDNGNKYIAYTFKNCVSARYYYKTDDRCSDSHTAVNLRFYLYNKAPLRGAIEEALGSASHIPQNPSFIDPQIGLTPQQWYYDNTNGCWDKYYSALQTALRVNACYITDQNTINAAADALDAAVAGLVVKGADYSLADAAYKRIANLTPANYTASSWAAVGKAWRAIGVNDSERDLTVFYQPYLNKLIADFNTAIDNLELEDADFTLVDRAEEKVPDDLSVYTDETVAALQQLITTADSDAFRAKKITEQDYIDSFAYAIEDAIIALQYKDADYSQVDALIAEYNSTYAPKKDTYTEETFNAYKAAVLSVMRGLKLDKQSLVDDMADKISTARDNLEFKEADYTAVEAAIDAAAMLDSKLYTTASWKALQDAINGVQYGLTVDKQSTVDGYAANINAKIKALIFADGDYSAVQEQVARYNALDKSWYEAAGISNVQSVINGITYGLKKDKQSQIDTYAANLKAAIDALVLKPANYTEADKQVARFESLASNKNLYTSASYSAALAASNVIKQNHDLTIDKQSTVDGYANDLKAAIDNLKFKPGDYSDVNSAVNTANEIIAKADAYSAAYNNNPYYTPATFNALKSAVNAVVYDLTVDKQSQIDGYASAINKAINNLDNNVADYTAVNAAKASVPADLDSGRYVASKVAAVHNAVNSATAGLLTDEQDIVDGFATSINAAVAALALNGADYTKVTAAINSKPADLTPYTSASVANLNNKINAVVYGLLIDEQSKVDAFAADIVKAIKDLELALASYAKVEAAKAAANAALNASEAQYYTAESKQAVKDAIDAVVYDLPAAQQSQVDGYAKAIDSAVAALKYNGLNTAPYEAAVKTFNGIDKSIYTDDSVKAVEDAIAAADAIVKKADASVKDQAALDSAVEAINAAIDALTLKGADYTDVDKAIDLANAYAVNKELYTNYDAVEAAVAAVIRDLAIDKQTDVDAMAKAINDAIAALQFKDIDKTGYEATKRTIPADLSIYTADSVKAVNDQIKAIDEFLGAEVDINDQPDLDEMVAELKVKIDELAKIPADYSELKKALADFESLNEDDYSNFSEKKAVYNAAKDWMSNGTVDFENQDEVDAWTDAVKKAMAELEAASAPEAYFVAKAGSTTIINDGSNFITGLKTALTLKELKEQFLAYDGVEVTFTKASRSARYYGTGSTVKVTYADGKVETYTIVIYGDLDGNGIIDVSDTATAQLAAVGSPLTAAQRFAANVDGVSRVTESDAVVISAAAAGKELNQVDPTM